MPKTLRKSESASMEGGNLDLLTKQADDNLMLVKEMKGIRWLSKKTGGNYMENTVEL